MFLKQLKVFSFRNLKNAEIEFHPSINLITGNNGQGKSNLIEAIHVVSSTKTFRSVQQRDLIQWGGEGFSVFGTVSFNNEASAELSSVPIGVSVEGKTKRVFLDDEPTRAVSEYLKVFPVVAFVPRDVDLVYGTPSGRRRFVDRYCSLVSPSYLNSLTAYQKVIRSKNALLKSIGGVDAKQLQTLNELVAEHGARITVFRSEFFRELTPHFSELYHAFANEDGEVNIIGEESFTSKGAAERSFDEYLRVLNELSGSEKERRTTLVGPHLDDFQVTLAERSARQFASQGQARSTVLSLLLGLSRIIEEKLQVVPSILLDDFSSELDSGRMRRFFELLSDMPCQVFITGTDLSEGVFGSKESALFTVQDGEITAL